MPAGRCLICVSLSSKPARCISSATWASPFFWALAVAWASTNAWVGLAALLNHVGPALAHLALFGACHVLFPNFLLMWMAGLLS